MALALAAVGNGVGTLILSPLAESIIARHDWRRAYVTIAIIAAVGLSLAAIAIVDRPGRTSTPPIGFRSAVATARRALADPGFRSLFYSATLMSIGLFVAFAFIVPFAIDDGVTSAGASRLVGLIGLSSILGRIGLMIVAARTSPVRLMQLTLVLQPLAYVIWLLAGGRYLALAAFAVVLGIAYGGFVAVSPESLIYLLGTRGIGMTMGILFLSFGVGGLIGPPAAGFLADSAGSNVVPIYVVIALLVAALAASIPMGRSAGGEAG
jgi:predicted MFS family arabinose efflux permease